MSGTSEATAADTNGAAPASTTTRVAADSRSVAAWTLVSRLTGLGRVVAIAAVLGPTYFGNLFQAVNHMPNLMFTFLVGPILTSLLVPPMVSMLDARDRARLSAFCRSLVGATVLGLGALAVLGMLLSPVLVGVLTIGVSDAAVAAAQRSSGTLLMILVLPQLVLYTVAGIGTAVQHAHGRFAVAAAVPALENLGVTATIGIYAARFGTRTDVADVGTDQLLLLGLGSTAAVAVHALAQVLAAARHRVYLLPSFRMRNPDVREVLRLSRSASATALIQGIRSLLALMVAGAVPGGVVAFRMAVNFYQLPVALGARPVAAVTVPELARLHQAGDRVALWHRWLRSISLALFVAVPAAFGYLLLAEPIARAVAFGEMASEDGVNLLAVSIASLSLGIIGETVYWVCASGSFAQRDGRTPLRANWIRAATAAVVIVTGFQLVEGIWILAVLGIGLTIGDTMAGLVTFRSVAKRLSTGERVILRSVARTVLAAAVATISSYGLVALLPIGPGRLADRVVLGVAVLYAATFYLLLQRVLGSPELAELLSGRGHRTRRRSRPPQGEPHQNGEHHPPEPVVGVDLWLRRWEAARPRIPSNAVDARLWLRNWSPSGPPGARLVGRARQRLRESQVNRQLVLGAETLTVCLVLLTAAVGSVMLLTTEPLIAVGLSLAAAIFVIVLTKPVAGAYLYLGLAPLVVGFDRDSVLPVLRPSEALLGLVLAAVVCRRAIHLFSGQEIRFQRTRLESSMLLLAVTSSFLPLLWMFARGLRPAFVDLLYASTVWKFFVLFLLIRSVVQTTQQIERCLYVVLGASAVVAVVAILQSAGIPPVISALETLYPTTGRDLSNNRGSSLLNSSHAVGDVMVINLALTMGLAYAKRWSPMLTVLAGLFFVATFASGQFSAIIALAIGAWVAGRLTKTLMASTTLALPLTAVATIAMRPIVERRLDGFSSAVGIPPSWQARWDNLTTFFWPELFSNYNFLLGVRPAARLPAPELWRNYVFIESGHTYLLWVGGVPYAIAYVLFTITAIRTATATAPRRDPVGAAAVAAAAGVWIVTAGMILDVHLTLRGTADLLFPLLAMVVAGRLIPPAVESSWPPARVRPASERTAAVT